MSKWAESESDTEDEMEVTSPVPSRSEDVEEEQLSPVASSSPVPTSTSPVPRPTAGDNKIGMVSGVPFDSTPALVRTWLESRGVKIERIEGLKNRTNQFNGNVVVYCVDSASLQILLDLQGEVFEKRTINTKIYEIRGNNKSKSGFRERKDGDRDRRSADRDRRDGDRDRRDGDRDRRSADKNRGEKDREAEREARGREFREKRAALELSPRTRPLEDIGKSSSQSDIYGGAKPRDEFQYQEKRRLEKAAVTTTTVTEGVAAISIDTSSQDVEAAPAPATTDSKKSRSGKNKNKKEKEKEKREASVSPLPEKEGEKTVFTSIDKKVKDHKDYKKGKKEKKEKREESSSPIPNQSTSQSADKQEDDDFVTVKRDSRPVRKSAPSPKPKEQEPAKEAPLKIAKSVSAGKLTAFAGLDESDEE